MNNKNKINSLLTGLWRWRSLILAVFIALLALQIRLDAASRLPVDADEDTYLNAALHYSDSIRTGNWKQIYKYDENNQHPALAKLSYVLTLLPEKSASHLQPKDIPFDVPVYLTPGARWILAARDMAAVWGGLKVFALSLLSPLAGLLLSFHSNDILYTSEVYLEALPAFTALLSMIAYDQWRRREFSPAGKNGGSRFRWLWLAASAVFLGMSGAGKYMYCLVGIAIVIDLVWRMVSERKLSNTHLAYLLGWAALALVLFFISNPIIWIHTIQRLLDSIVFHVNYSQSWDVKGAHRAWWFPLYLLTHSVSAYRPDLKNFFAIRPELFIALLGLLGLPLLWLRQRPYAIWLLVVVAFLLLWPTKWDQYTMLALAPLCYSAGHLLEWAIAWAFKRIRSRYSISQTAA
ncbi:MAG: hypothetical protein P4L50_04110 [Anaerolineaceae bacterium]|nr:hypothetical protein [Anaerolineaceae bacterium]